MFDLGAGNIDNLLKPDDLTPEERRENASKAGKASVEARREKKRLRECLDVFLSAEYGKEGNRLNGREAMAFSAVTAAMRGDWKAWELVRDTVGEKPIEKIMVADVDAEVVEQIENMVLGK